MAVTVCAVCHVVGVKVSTPAGAAVVTVTALVSPVASVTVTGPVGTTPKARVYAAGVELPSRTARAPLCTPAVSGSVSTTRTGSSSSVTVTVVLGTASGICCAPGRRYPCCRALPSTA